MGGQEDVLGALGAAVRTIRARLDRALRTDGLRLGQYQVLRVLWSEDGLTPRELSARLEVEMPTVTRTVQRMIRDGLVRREDHPSDARSVYIYLTERGSALRVLVERLLERETATFLSGFSAEERALLIAFLERMRTNAR
ncbi:MAG TPA: MarR family transcriptional regulator [Candidatus Baltobacteraceae bacterium]|jgi:DNA-binding MarR family transcriptional regulator|nr:MarR family transcriptional regulator [Candidatus Baltobacteraceae bacterium]